MGSFVEAQQWLLDDLTAKGVVAASHARKLHNFPAVLIVPAEFDYNRLSKQAYTARFEAYIVARDSGMDNQPLDDLYPLAKLLAEEYGATRFEPISATLANVSGADGLPALKTEITITVKEDI
ncbi:hypothetical protein E4U03_10960 [Rothia nasimurium]|uniref:DUF3168 domain-containing protein n=1 Tax=Rothia nasimurium TaxID=85336 RepID=A0A4Y9F0Q8_9MICC|nr:hypothetical protein [Rothia nasimurium]MBF0809118.1 hypothetical protein [Rothia nasimurium]TFU20640.1 hypothetical protein E4U03_10960 [Rothia nasimurium]